MGYVLTIDTLAYARRLKEAGIPEKQAEAQAELHAETLKALSQTIENDLATKRDIKGLELRIIKWMVGLLIGQTALILAMIQLKLP